MADLLKDIHWAKQSCRSHRNYKEIDDNTLQFSCPYCGDSTYDKKKARGGIYLSPKQLFKYNCFNCEVGPISLQQFLRETDMVTYKLYVMDMYDHKKRTPKEEFVVPTVKVPEVKKSEFFDAWAIPDVAEYLNKRGTPKRDIKFLPNYVKWANDKGFRKSEYIPPSDPRVVLECRGLDNELIGYIGRTTGESTLRYNNIKLNSSFNNLVFGLNDINTTTIVNAVEGAFDSLFLDNCIAISSSALHTAEQYVPKNNLRLVWDNEPRNKTICTLMERAIKDNFKVVIWPSDITGKDVNDMVLNGHTDINEIIQSNTYDGLAATMKFSQWKRV